MLGHGKPNGGWTVIDDADERETLVGAMTDANGAVGDVVADLIEPADGLQMKWFPLAVFPGSGHRPSRTPRGRPFEGGLTLYAVSGTHRVAVTRGDANPGAETEPVTRYFLFGVCLDDVSRAYWLDGTAGPIQMAVREGPLSPAGAGADAATVDLAILDYLRFACEFAQGDDETFCVIDGVDEFDEVAAGSGPAAVPGTLTLLGVFVGVFALCFVGLSEPQALGRSDAWRLAHADVRTGDPGRPPVGPMPVPATTAPAAVGRAATAPTIAATAPTIAATTPTAASPARPLVAVSSELDEGTPSTYSDPFFVTLRHVLPMFTMDSGGDWSPTDDHPFHVGPVRLQWGPSCRVSPQDVLGLVSLGAWVWWALVLLTISLKVMRMMGSPGA